MHPPAYPHDELKALHPDVYFLHGSINMGPGMRMNRNMIVLISGDELVLINPVRMGSHGLARLDELGCVKYILRLGDFHGLDDAFYLERYKCEFWAQTEQSTYKHPEPSTIITSTTKPPFPNSRFFLFESAMYPESALLLTEYKLLITTDSVQYHADWSYFSWFTKFAFNLLGFKTGINIGGPWLKRVTPKGDSLKREFERLLLLDFDSIVAAHGVPLESGAKEALYKEIHTVFK